jgi:RimJ/RimL family protein N-acetyltransferase
MFARTPRLLLRPGWIEDAPALAAAISDRAVVDNLATAPWPYTVTEAEQFLSHRPDPMQLSLVILRRTLGAPQLIGSIGLKRLHDGAAEIGFWITRTCWGLGFATEAGRAMIDIARHALGLEELRATTFADNFSSQNVLAKLGFTPSGNALRHCAARDAALPARSFRMRLDQGAEGLISLAA